MKFTQVITLVTGVMPMIATASPAQAAPGKVLSAQGIDVCDVKGNIGDTCNFGPDDGQPHICGGGDPRDILHCVEGKWQVERQCNVGQHCGCHGENARGDITCNE